MEFFIAVGLVWAMAVFYRLTHRPRSRSRYAPPIKERLTVRPAASFSPSPSQAPLVTDAVWVPLGQATYIANRMLPGGLLYLGSELSSISGLVVEPALIDPKLPVNISDVDRAGWDVGHWPSYSEMPPASRAAYLEWHASGRNDPYAYIGYVFLHFFGLERRLLASSESSQDPIGEARIIYSEVKRLLQVYGANPHFRKCALRFLDAIKAVLGGGRGYSEHLVFPTQDHDFPLGLKVELGRQAMSGKPVPAAQALAWVICDPSRWLRTPAWRCRKEFVKLFHHHYAEAFGGGFKLKPKGAELRAIYHPVSPSFALPVELPVPNLPDVTTQEEVGRLFWDIAERCTDELEPYSRWLGSGEADKSGLISSAWSPAALAKDYETPETHSLAALLDQSLRNTDFLTIEAEALFERWAMPDLRVSTYQDVSVLAQLLGKLGYGIEPDLRFSDRRLDPAGKAVIFRLPAEGSMTPSRNYTTALTVLRLAAAASLHGAGLSMNDTLRLVKYFHVRLLLSPAEGVRLQAYFRWLLKDPVDPIALRKRLDQLDEKQRTLITRFLVSVLGPRRDGDMASFRLLSKISQALRLDFKKLSPRLRLSADPGGLISHDRKEAEHAASPLPTDDGGAGTQSSLLPRPITGKDLARITMILAGTSGVNEMASEVLPGQGMNGDALKLSDDDSAFIRDLAQKTLWPRCDLERLARKANMFLEGLIDKLNDVAIHNYGELLLEGEDPVEINQNVIRVMLQ